MNILTNDNITLNVETAGKGPACLYLHGGPGYWSQSFKHFAGPLLENRIEMIYLDQRGCGLSQHDENQNYSLDRLIEDIEDVRKALNIQKWYVIGHSFGGILAANYAKHYPAHVEGLILSNATLNFKSSITHQIKKGFNLLEIQHQEIPSENLSAFMDLFNNVLERLVREGKYFSMQFRELSAKQKLDGVDEDLNTDPAFQQYVFSSEDYFRDFTELTQDINIPVMVISGKYDDAIGPDHYKAFRFPDMSVQMIEGAHHPYVENQEEFKASVLQFVNTREKRKTL